MPQTFNPKRTAFSAIFLLLLFGYMLSRKPAPEPHPKFMGVTFGAVPFKVLTADANLNHVEKSELGIAFSRELDRVNHTMSTWREDSEITAFNQTNATDWIEISTNFAKVVQAALLFAEETDGAFDPTAGVRKRNYKHGPDAGEPAETPIGFAMLEQEGMRIRKTNPDLQFDLDAIAKGYAVDKVSDLLVERGITNHLVEVGGEIRTRGISPLGEPWPVHIQVPKADGGIYQTIKQRDQSIATSGTAYQASHFIDPVSGLAVSNAVRSVSVIAPSCMEADALATAYMVMGLEKGLAHAENRPGTEAMFLHVKDGILDESKTAGFP